MTKRMPARIWGAACILCLGAMSRGHTSGQLQRRQLQTSPVQPLSFSAKAIFAREHNAARCRKSLPSLAWSQAVADSAATWAGVCNFAQSKQAGVSNGGRGENVYAASLHEAPETAAAAALEKFNAEEVHWSCAKNSCSGVCEHYTQVVWENTSAFGCAVAHCNASNPFATDLYGPGWTLVVCQYDPAPARKTSAVPTCTGTTDGAGSACALNARQTGCEISNGNCNTSTSTNCGGDCVFTGTSIAARPFPLSGCSLNASNCAANGSALDTAAVEAGIPADVGSLEEPPCVVAVDSPNTVDVLVLYTREALASASGLVSVLQARATAGMAEANAALARSQVELVVNLSAVELAPFSEATMSSGAQLLSALAASPAVGMRRNFWAADLVTLLATTSSASYLLGSKDVTIAPAACAGSTDANGTACALNSFGDACKNSTGNCSYTDAEISSGGAPTQGFSVANVAETEDASQLAFGRALGANFGCATDMGNAGSPPARAHAHGYRQLGRQPYFRTIMASGLAACPGELGCPIVPYFSNPRISKTFNAGWGGNSEPMTLPLGTSSADCASTIQETRTLVANYRVSSSTCASSGGVVRMLASGSAAALVGRCPADCSFHGSCDYLSLTCRCRQPWTGIDCSLRRCPADCQNGRGRCDLRSGHCICHPGWTGYSCGIQVPNFCPGGCPGGTCQEDGTCSCTNTYATNQLGQGTLSDTRPFAGTEGTVHDTSKSAEYQQCDGADGECWRGSELSTLADAPRVERAIAEVGRLVATRNPREHGGAPESGWQTVQLQEEYASPLVFISAPTDNEATPASARVRSVRQGLDCGSGVGSPTQHCFDVRLQELACSDDDMHAAESVDYLVIDAGWWLTSGDNRGAFLAGNAMGTAKFMAMAIEIDGTAATSCSAVAPSGVNVTCGTGDGWMTASFGSLFVSDSAPIVLTQIQTNADPSPVLVRHHNVTTASVALRLQDDVPSLVAAGPSTHGQEVVALLAVTEMPGGIGGVGGERRRRRFQSKLLSTPISATEPVAIEFRADFGSYPRVFAQLQTTAADATAPAVQLRTLKPHLQAPSAAHPWEGCAVDVTAAGPCAPRLVSNPAVGIDERWDSTIPGWAMSRTDGLESSASERASSAVTAVTPSDLGLDLVGNHGNWSAGTYTAVARRAWVFLQPRAGSASVCNGGLGLRECGGNGGWSRGGVAPGLQECAGGLCTVRPGYSYHDTTIPFPPDGCTLLSPAGDMRFCNNSCVPRGSSCYDPSKCSAPGDVPPPETVGFLAIDGGTASGVETIQAYPLHPPTHATTGDCGVHAGPATCRGRGVPVPGLDRLGLPRAPSMATCACNTGFFGPTCEYAVCPNNHCGRTPLQPWGRGRCRHVDEEGGAAGSCACNAGYTGVGCIHRTCLDDCGQRGTCDSVTGKCKCQLPFFGANCAQAQCGCMVSNSSSNESVGHVCVGCLNGGTCNHATGVCTCTPPMAGVYCQLNTTDPVPPNASNTSGIGQTSGLSGLAVAPVHWG